MMFPDRCSVLEKKVHCPNPPEFVISVLVKSDEYMVGVTCGRHREVVSKKIDALQSRGTIPQGIITFSALKAVGTNCIKGDESDLIQL